MRPGDAQPVDDRVPPARRTDDVNRPKRDVRDLGHVDCELTPSLSIGSLSDSFRQRSRVAYARACLLAVVGLAAAALTTPALASIGTGVAAIPLSIGNARPGHSYTVKWLYVKNTGTVSSSYVVRALRLSKGSALVVPARWIHLSPDRLRLVPNEIGHVAVTITVPASAGSGDYLTNLVAATYVHSSAGGAALGAAAGDRLTVQIPSESSFPWPLVVIGGGIALLLSAIWMLHRFGLRIHVDRHPGSDQTAQTVD
jgi:hypothetical protein